MSAVQQEPVPELADLRELRLHVAELEGAGGKMCSASSSCACCTSRMSAQNPGAARRQDRLDLGALLCRQIRRPQEDRQRAPARQAAPRVAQRPLRRERGRAEQAREKRRGDDGAPHTAHRDCRHGSSPDSSLGIVIDTVGSMAPTRTPSVPRARALVPPPGVARFAQHRRSLGDHGPGLAFHREQGRQMSASATATCRRASSGAAGSGGGSHDDQSSTPPAAAASPVTTGHRRTGADARRRWVPVTSAWTTASTAPSTARYRAAQSGHPARWARSPALPSPASAARRPRRADSALSEASEPAAQAVDGTEEVALENARAQREGQGSPPSTGPR